MSDFEKLINASDLIEWIIETDPDWCVGSVRSIIDHIDKMPSAQPEKRTDKCTKTHSCDCISRQAAINEIKSLFLNVPYSEKNIAWSMALTKIRQLPSAQTDLDEVYAHAETEAEARFHDKIVRCKDCKYNSNTCGNYVNCDIIPQMFGRTTDNFCSRAERRTDDTD